MSEAVPPPAPQRRTTSLIHHPYSPPPGFEAVQPGVHKASTVIFPDVAALRARRWVDKSGYTYGLHGTPTTFTLEARIASLEGGTHALLAPSGLAAIVLVDGALLQAGDHVLLPDNVYAPAREFARVDLARWGITHAIYDPMDAGSLAAALTPATRLVWLEAAGSVTLEFPDLPALLRCVRERAPQALVALDNTWGAGLAFRPFEIAGVPGGAAGVDISVQALTKYVSGGADVLMGSVVVRDRALHERLALAHSRSGSGVCGNDVELVLRSLPSLPLRYAAHDAAARRFAAWCTQRSEFSRVLHPALPGSPGHEHWAGLCGAAAGLVSVCFDDASHGPQRVDAFLDALRLFRLGYSWGGPVSLVVPYRPAGMRRQGPAHAGTLVRFSIGLEAVEDLIGDVHQALARLAA